MWVPPLNGNSIIKFAKIVTYSVIMMGKKGEKETFLLSVFSTADYY